MGDSKAMEILKKAIILEQQGQSFYRKVAEQTESEAVRNIFSIMADEEKDHEEILFRQAEKYRESGGFLSEIDLGQPEEFSSRVLSKEIREQISAAGYEAASISAAVAFEERSVALYTERANEADDEAEKSLYSDLAAWERSHLAFVSEIYDDLLETTYYDSSYWPF